MDALVKMSAPPALGSIGHQARELAPPGSAARQQQQQQQAQTISIRTAAPTTVTTISSGNAVTGAQRVSSPHKETGTTSGATAGGATVFVAASVPDVVAHTNRIPEVQLANGSTAAVAAVSQLNQQHQIIDNLPKPAHVVKIKINPGNDNSASTKVISAVRLNLEDVPYDIDNCVRSNSNSVIVFTNNNNNHDDIDNNNRCNNNKTTTIVNGNSGEPCVTISVKSNGCDNYSGSESSSEELQSQQTSIEHQHADMVQQRSVSESLNTASRASSSCFYYSSPLSTMVMSSGQCSPSETLDSGTCSDLDGTPPPLPKKKGSSTVIVGSSASTTALHHHHQRHDRTGSLTSSGAEVDSDDNESSISCDSLNSGEVPLNGHVKFRVTRNLELRTPVKQLKDNGEESKKETIETHVNVIEDIKINNSGRLDESELTHLKINKSPSISPPASGTSTLSKASSTPRIRSPEVPGTRRSSICSSSSSSALVNECTYEERRREQECNNDNNDSTLTNNRCATKYVYEDDRYYKFHVNERDETAKLEKSKENGESIAENDDECFAGYKILEREAIRSAKGTVRGVKNRVRAGIATFLQKPTSKNYKAKDAGKVVVYTTTMGIVRETYYRCVKVKQILRTHMVKYEERDMYMSTESQTELRDRIGCTAIEVPQLFIDGQYIGDADKVERLNEMGELRQMLKPYKSLDACSTCKVCGGYRLLPCPVCNGSKKSVHRNDFTAEFIALKCMNCDEVGLVRCQHC